MRCVFDKISLACSVTNLKEKASLFTAIACDKLQVSLNCSVRAATQSTAKRSGMCHNVSICAAIYSDILYNIGTFEVTMYIYVHG